MTSDQAATVIAQLTSIYQAEQMLYIIAGMVFGGIVFLAYKAGRR